MARPKKNNADYFSHDSGMRNDPKIMAVRRKFGNDGYSIWCMILEVLTGSENFKCKWNDLSIELISGDFDVDSVTLKDVVEYMILIQLLSSDGNYIFSQKLIERFAGLVAKRKREQLPEKSQISNYATINDISVNTNTVLNELSTSETEQKKIIDVENPHSKVNKSKVNKSKENNTPVEFVTFWEKYPGSKLSVNTEYKKFIRKNRTETLPLLLPGLEKELKHREFLKSQKHFVPNLKNLSTWINNRCWEQELPAFNDLDANGQRPPRPSRQHIWSENQQKWTVQ